MIGLFGYQEIGLNSKNGFVCKPYASTQVEYFFDKPFKAARAFAIMASACSGLTLLLLIMTSCLAYPPMILQSLAGLSFFGSISILFTFLMYASVVGDEPFNGSFYYGGAITILGCLSCFITGLLLLQIQPPGSHNYIVRESSPNQNTVTSRGSPNASNAATTPSTGKRNFPPAKRVVQTHAAKPEAAIPRNNNNNANPNDIEAFQPGTETITETLLPDGTKKVVTTVVDIDGSTTVTETIVRTE